MDQFLESLGNGFGNAAGSSAGGAILGGMFGKSDGAVRRQARRDRNRGMTDAVNLMKIGNEMDMSNQKAMFDHRINAGLVAGMTPYEMFVGSSAGGAGGGTTGSGSTLGNQAGQLSAQSAQLAQERDLMQQENNANRITDLTKATIDAKAKVDVAKIGAGATTGAAETGAQATRDAAEIHAEVARAQNQVRQGELDLKTREYEEIMVPAAAAKLNLTEQQVKHEANKVATSTPEFLRAMKILTMSAENLLATVLVNGQPVDVTDPKNLAKLSVADRAKLVTTLVGVTSRSYREATGIQQKAGEVLQRYFEMLEQDQKREPTYTDIPETPQLGVKPPRDAPRVPNSGFRGRYSLPSTLGAQG